MQNEKIPADSPDPVAVPTNPTSEAQAAASRANGAKSSGPKTVAGKLVSRRNALTHGETAKTLTLNKESDDRFIRILAALEAQLQPANELEQQLVESIAQARWRTIRTWLQEKTVLDVAMEEVRRTSTDPNLRNADCGGLAFRNLADQSRVLTMLDRNENRYQRIYHRSLHEFFTAREREQKAKLRSENALTNPVSSSKQSPAQKTNPANPAPSDLMRDRIPSEVLQCRMEAARRHTEASAQQDVDEKLVA